MIQHTLIKLLKRDLAKLIKELEMYKNEKNLWITSKEISNSAGNLSLHIVGNLNWFIGAELGNTGYIRQRDLEFSLKDIARADLITDIQKTAAVVEKVIGNLSLEDLNKIYPKEVFKEPMTNEFFIAHLATHLSYHLGQINYHRRLLDS